MVAFCEVQFCFKLKRNFALLPQTCKDQAVGVDKCNKNRTGSSRRKEFRISKHISIILTPVIILFY